MEVTKINVWLEQCNQYNWNNIYIVVCSFAIVNPGSIFFSLYMYVPIGILFHAHQYHIFNHFL